LKNIKDNLGIATGLKDLLNLSNKYNSELESISRLSNPMENYNKQMEAMLKLPDPMEKYHRQMEEMLKLPDPMEKYHRQMEAMLKLPDPMEKYHRQMEEMLKLPDPMEKYHRQMEEMLKLPDPMEKYHRQMEAMFKSPDPMEKYHKQMDMMLNIPDSMGAFQRAFSSLNIKVIEKFKDVALSVHDDVYIDKSGNISLSTTQILVEELQKLSNEIINRSTDKFAQSIEDSFTNLIIEIQKQRDPLMQKMLMWFLYPFIVGVILSFVNPVADQFVRSNLQQTKKEVVKEIKANVKSTVENIELLKAMKLVSADVLNVRADASNQSDLIGQLQFSSVVLVIEKRKNWSLIQWSNPDTGVSIKGWVFSRYLKSFN
jgi:hypothetical protein